MLSSSTLHFSDYNLCIFVWSILFSNSLKWFIFQYFFIVENICSYLLSCLKCEWIAFSCISIFVVWPKSWLLEPARHQSIVNQNVKIGHQHLRLVINTFCIQQSSSTRAPRTDFFDLSGRLHLNIYNVYLNIF